MLGQLPERQRLPRLWSPGIKSWAKITSHALLWGQDFRGTSWKQLGEGRGNAWNGEGWWVPKVVAEQSLGVRDGHSPQHHGLPDGPPSPGAPVLTQLIPACSPHWDPSLP